MTSNLPFPGALRVGLFATMTAVLVACGGSSETAPGAETSSVPQARAKPTGFLGSWSAPVNATVNPASMANLPNGKVLLWSGSDMGGWGGASQTQSSIFDPTTGSFTNRVITDTQHDMFCTGTSNLPDGRLVINGGQTSGVTSIYDPSNNSWSRGGAMARTRGYTANATLEDGSVITLGGSWSGGVGGKGGEIYTPGTNSWRLLSGVPIDPFVANSAATQLSVDQVDNHMWLVPSGNGRVLHVGPSQAMNWIDTNGNGATVSAGLRGDDVYSMSGNAVMFDTGKILKTGGAPGYHGVDSTGGAFLVDAAQRNTNGQPAVRRLASPTYRRGMHNSVVLPNGQVVLLGGQTRQDGTNSNNSILVPELFDPETESFTSLPAVTAWHNYHSVAVLLPDARVMLVGSNYGFGPQNQQMQILSPHYLFGADGSTADRPTLLTVPAQASHGATLNVTTDTAITSFSIVRLSSTTHGVANDQRRLKLDFTANGGNSYGVKIPTNPGWALPGYWMLFALNANGVPSVSKQIQITGAGEPRILNPGDQTNTGAAVNLAPSVSGATSVQATGLPPGLTVNTANGQITGTPTTNGTYQVSLIAINGAGTVSTDWQWTATNAAPTNPLVLNQNVAAPVLTAGGSASYTTSATGTGVTYSWNYGDGSAATAFSTNANTAHTFVNPGLYTVTVTAKDETGAIKTYSFTQAIYGAASSAGKPTVSTNVLFQTRTGANPLVWLVNQDNDTVSAFDTTNNLRLSEIAVGTSPRSLALAPDGRLWVVNKQSATLSIINPTSMAVVQTVNLPRASMPFGVVFAPNGSAAYVTLEATGQLLQLNPTTGATVKALDVGANPRHLSVMPASDRVLVSRFITPVLPGEATATVQTAGAGGEVVVVTTATLAVERKLLLQHSEKQDDTNQGRGIPNYLNAAVIAPDGRSAWVPSKQDNIKRGTLRDGTGLNFQSTVRAISSRLDLVAFTEDYAARVDHDNSSLGSAAVYHPTGAYLFVALETSREVAVLDPVGKREITRFAVGRAPDGLAVSADGLKLYVNNFMDRTLGVYDLTRLLSYGQFNVPLLATTGAVGAEKLTNQVLVGKQFFYDAKDTRLAADSYMSCASCHNDGGHDGRVWDFTGQGEGLRNTISLRGRAGAQGFKHWTANFDEIQDFEGQIRSLAGGTGLMTDAQFNTGSRNQPLGDTKAGVNADLDALAAYVSSLATFADSPTRDASGALTPTAVLGKTVFANNCASCHGGAGFTNSANANLMDIGTVKPSSGKRLGATLTGIDTPTLRDVWATAPYLHNGSAATLSDAITAHNTVTLTAADLANVVAFTQQIGGTEPAVPYTGPATGIGTGAGTGTGLTGQYFNTRDFTGAVAMTRIEAVNFAYDHSPGTGVNAYNFSVRWTGQLEAPTTGNYQFQTYSDDGVRLKVNGQFMVNNWTDHGPTYNTSGTLAMTAGQKVSITMEFYQAYGGATAQLAWMVPGATAYAVVPVGRLYPSAPVVVPPVTPVVLALTAANTTRLSAAQVQADGGMVLTNAGGQKGAVWASTPWSTTQAFETSFEFKLQGNAGAIQADGIAFVLQNTGLNAIGDGGGYVGAFNLSTNWLGAVVRTYYNNQTGFSNNGSAPKAAGFAIGSYALVTGKMTVAYNPATTVLTMITVFILPDGSTRTVTDTLTVNLQQKFGATMYVGTTGGTGGATSTQVIYNWNRTK